MNSVASRIPWLAIVGAVMLIPTHVMAQVALLWATTLDDRGRTDVAEFVTLDASGSVIVAGTSLGSTDADLRLAKFDAAGTVVWSHRVPFGSTALGGSGLTTDDAGNIVVACNESLGSSDIRVVTLKVSPDGNELWRAIYDIPGAQDIASGIERDELGRAFVGGHTEYATQSPTKAPAIDAFIVAYDTNGSVPWQDVYASGRFQNAIFDLTRDPNTGALHLAGQGPLVLRYESTARRRWAKRYKNIDGFQFAERVVVAGDGTLAVAGFFHDTPISSDVDIAVMKLEASSGRDLWTTVYGTANGDPQFEDRVLGLAADIGGGLRVSGRVFQPGFTDSLVLDISPDGALAWAANDDRVDLSTGAIELDASGNSHLTGGRLVPRGLGFTTPA